MAHGASAISIMRKNGSKHGNSKDVLSTSQLLMGLPVSKKRKVPESVKIEFSHGQTFTTQTYYFKTINCAL